MSELSQPSLLVEAQTPIDSDLRSAYENLVESSPAIYNQLKVLKGVNEVLRDRFLAAGRSENPDLRATHLNNDELLRQESAWLNFKDGLKSADLEPDVKQAYRWAVNEAIANAKMARASASGDMRRFQAYNEFIYGRRNQDIFAATADWFRQSAAGLTAHNNPAIKEMADRVLELVPDMGGDRGRLIPPAEVFEAVRRQHYAEGGYFALLLAGVELPTEGKVPKIIGDRAIRQVIQNIGSELGIVHVGGTAFAINRHIGAVESPESYSWVLKRFIGLPLAHEVGGHELEYQNGLRQRLQLFAVGLDRFEAGNEGRAVIREQLPYETFDDFAKTLRWQDIMRRHFAVCLATGSAGQPMDFVKTFEIINAVDRLWERKKPAADVTKADATADQRTWDLLSTKVFVGTNGQAGIAYQKNAVYLEGEVRGWRYPELIRLGDGGKFDITNPRHIGLAQRFGVLPAQP